MTEISWYSQQWDYVVVKYNLLNKKKDNIPLRWYGRRNGNHGKFAIVKFNCI
ncbi:MAG: hypothetical protein ABI359_08280 [Ginsengibacter sp.]